MTTPFESHPKIRRAQLARAEQKVLEAIAALQQAKTASDNWAEYETITAFETQLKLFLSNSHGEAGFQPYRAQERAR